MLDFFRRYQRFFFVFVSVVIILSFSFFGTFSAILSTKSVPDRVIGKAIDGSPLKERQIESMVRFLSNAFEDRDSMQRRLVPNVLNDSVVFKDFIATGMGALLAEKYFDQIKPDLEERFKKTRFFKSYTHPNAPFISANLVWERFNPDLIVHLNAFKEKSQEVTPESFSLLCKLYEDQAKFSPALVRQIIAYQQAQYNWLRPDPMLDQTNFALFGFQTLEDWVGKKFLELTTHFIIDSAILAEQRGYSVSLEEARADLFHNAQVGLQSFAEKGEISNSQLNEYINGEIRALGLDEQAVVKIWQKVLLFRRLFHDVGNAVLVDTFAHENFQQYAQETVSVDVYQLAPALRLQDFGSMVRFQTYLEAIAGKKWGHSLALPKEFQNAEEVERTYPELVKHRFVLEYAEANIDAVAQKVSVKETWDWELLDAHWEPLKKQFPILASGLCETREQKFLLLDGLEPKTRLQIDQFARRQVIKAHPEWIRSALEEAELKTEVVNFRLKGGSLPFKGLEDSSDLLALLLSCPLKEEESLSDAAQLLREKLSQCTFDSEHFYKIALVKKGEGKEILSFEEANDSAIEAIADRNLEEAYSDLKKKNPTLFQEPDGSFKPFNEVKDLVASKVYAPLLSKIEQDCSQEGFIMPNSIPLEFYVQNRFNFYLRESKQEIEQNKEHSNLVVDTAIAQDTSDLQVKSLDSQWALNKTPLQLSRGDQSPLFTPEMFSMPIGAWSPLNSFGNSGSFFFQLSDRSILAAKIEEDVEKAREALSVEARRTFMRSVLDLIEEKQPICLKSEDSQEWF